MYADLLINPYGKAAIQYEHQQIENSKGDRYVENALLARGLRFKANENGSLNIHRHNDKMEYVIVIVNNDKKWQTVAVDARQMRVLYNYWLNSDGLTQRQLDHDVAETRKYIDEELAKKPKVYVKLANKYDVQRVDIRFAKQWITLTFFRSKLFNVRMNGDFFTSTMNALCMADRQHDLSFGPGFIRDEDDPLFVSNSEDSDDEPASQHMRLLPKYSHGPPPIEEKEKQNALMTQKMIRTPTGLQRPSTIKSSTADGGMYHTLAPWRPPKPSVASTGFRLVMPPTTSMNPYEPSASYTPPRRIDLPLTMTPPGQSLPQNPLQSVAPTNAPENTPAMSMPSPSNAEQAEMTKNEEQKSVKSKKSKFSAKSVQKAFLQAIASINFESDDSD